MTLEVIDEENSRMESMGDIVSQRDATNPFEAMRALRKAETQNVKADIRPEI
jgi:hypothetical protein